MGGVGWGPSSYPIATGSAQLHRPPPGTPLTPAHVCAHMYSQTRITDGGLHGPKSQGVMEKAQSNRQVLLRQSSTSLSSVSSSVK